MVATTQNIVNNFLHKNLCNSTIFVNFVEQNRTGLSYKLYKNFYNMMPEQSNKVCSGENFLPSTQCLDTTVYIYNSSATKNTTKKTYKSSTSTENVLSENGKSTSAIQKVLLSNDNDTFPIGKILLTNYKIIDKNKIEIIKKNTNKKITQNGRSKNT